MEPTVFEPTASLATWFYLPFGIPDDSALHLPN